MLVLISGCVDVDFNLGASFGFAFESDIGANVDVAFWFRC